MADEPKAEITLALKRLKSGDSHAADDLFTLVYEQLREMARQQFRHERRAHTLQPTALVHKAYLALVEHENLNFEQRAHFFATAAKIMRQLLVDHARSRGRRKRGGDRKREPLHPDTLVISHDDDVLRVEDALEKLATIDPRQAKIVELRFFGGLTVEEVATVLDVSKRTVEAEWTMIRAWLRKELAEESP